MLNDSHALENANDEFAPDGTKGLIISYPFSFPKNINK